ncbi:MAG: MBL fold metallo-hydrolase [Anaerolineaceae bacterium]|nr:MBL fold metallo-hydrolase [Anaerolineaceae bacterium]
MKLTTYGAAQTVTGSMHMVEVNGRTLLMDCGMYQGKRDDTYKVNLNFPFDPRSLDCVVLSHAHIDHSGNLPNLVRQGFQGPIWTTNATADLTDIMLRDSGRIQEDDIKYVNKVRARQGLTHMEPLYTEKNAIETAPRFRSVFYEQAFNPIPGVTVTLHDAGHIIGSASVCVDVEENGTKKRLWFSGDIGRKEAPILNDPVLPSNADYLLMECTYGDIVHPPMEEAFAEFKELVLRTIKRGGKVIVPAFAVGRTQNLSYYLGQAIDQGEIPPIPVIVDSPLAVSASDIYRRHTECFDEETARMLQEHRSPYLDFDHIIYTHSVDESKAINSFKEPCIIISASGMAENGRILHHLRNNIEDGRNSIALISYMAPDTLGRRLQEGQTKVRIFGEQFFRKAEVARIEGFSAHGGQDMLVDYVKATSNSLKKLILVHGEEDPEKALLNKLKQEVNLPDTVYPAKAENFEL